MLAFDCESSGLREHDRPFGLSIAGPDHAEWVDSRQYPQDVIAAAIATLNEQPVLIAQNAKFDMRMLRHWGLDPRGEIHDTEVLGRLVRNDHLTYGLAAAAKREGLEKLTIADDYIKKHKLYRHEGEEKIPCFDRIPAEIIAQYAAHDARVTYDLYQKLLPQLDPRSLPVWQMEVKLTKVCYQMERTGIAVDMAYVKAAKAHEEGLIREAKHQFHLASGLPYDNKKATFVEVFSKAGEIIPKTVKGNDSLTDDVLESFTSPIAKLVQKIRHYEKRVSTYYDSFLRLATGESVIHPDMRQAGTATGRFSYREPNLQNLPKEEGSVAPYTIRGCFKPRPGYVFVVMDYSQMEYRLMLDYANHWSLIEQVNGGADVHQAMADMVGITRSQAKTLNFAILYGAGGEKIAAMLGIPADEAYALKKKYFSKLLEVQAFISKVVSAGEKRGHVYNWLGRKLHINDQRFAYKLPNHLIQGGGADICKVAMVACADLVRPYDCRMVLQVHDAIYFEMKKEDMAHLIPPLRQAMIDAYTPRNSMAMDVDVQWSEKSLAERDLVEWTSK